MRSTESKPSANMKYMSARNSERRNIVQRRRDNIYADVLGRNFERDL